MWCRRTLLVRVLPDENALPRRGLPVDVPLARVVLEHDCLVADRLHVLGQERDLPAASRRVDHEMGHGEPRGPSAQRSDDLDRKSTRLNSSHGYISYAVFCLKKKKNKDILITVERKNVGAIYTRLPPVD